MSDKCFICRGYSEQVDSIPLCHICYEKVADPESPLYNPRLLAAYS